MPGLPKDSAGYLERIRDLYFSDPAKRLRLSEGERLMVQDEPNTRLFQVISGEFIGATTMENLLGEQERLELFRVGPGSFLGVHSFFAESGLASLTVVAASEGELAYIDRGAEAVEREQYGSLTEQFFPVVLKEMDRRQLNFHRAAKEREEYIKRLHLAEAMATLGQFAAGLAHELNNATGVIMSASEHLCAFMGGFLDERAPDLAAWFGRGSENPRSLGSAEVRAGARALMKKHKLEYEEAKDLVRMTGGKGLKEAPSALLARRPAWKAGKSCRDLRMAAGHAADIIHSIKQLSSGGHAPRVAVDVAESVREALTLLRGAVQRAEVRLDLDPGLPAITANKSELMQIWVNLIKNAVEAQKEAATPLPWIAVRAEKRCAEVCVTIANNGPAFPPALKARLFQPNITTKSGEGSSMGLGLGLYITKRLVDSHNGSIRLEDGNGGTAFVICLPLK